jgi:hypothetical protein
VKRILRCLLLLSLLMSACQAGSPTQTAQTQQSPLATSEMEPPLTADSAPEQTSQADPGEAAPVEAERLLEGFEGASTSWQAGRSPNYSDSSAQTVELSAEGATQGSQALRLAYDAGALPKAIFFSEKPLDLTRMRYLNLDLRTAAGEAGWAALSLSTGSSWTWHESLPVPLQAGANTLSFDLEAEIYQTARSSWQPVAGLDDLAQVQRLAIIVYACSAEMDGLNAVPGACQEAETIPQGVLYLDNIRLGDSAAGVEPAAFSLPTQAPVEPQAATFLELDALSLETRVYERFELAVKTDGVYANPFDPAEADLRVRFQGPSGQEALVPAFWYQEYHQEGMATTGAPQWRVRFTPTAPGDWQATAFLGRLESAPIQFKALAATGRAHGFIRIQDERFVFDDGAAYYPIGINIGWGSGDQVSIYEHWLEQFSENGGSLIRVWMASWSFGLEWDDTGLGNYTNRQYRAWQLDRIFEMAEARRVAIELVLLNHGAFSKTVNPEWDGNPYNVENGGMCKSPDCFATDPQAREFFKNRLRYIAARWGYSTALFAWEWWNEADWTPINDDEMAAWIQEMTPVLLSFDPNEHLVSTSYAQSARPKINSLPEIDFSQVHLYSSVNPALQFPYLYQERSQSAPGKPVLFAEFGADSGGENSDSPDRQGLHLHNGLWAGVFSGFASPGMYWWWDSYVDPLNLWPVFARLSRFLEGEDPGAMAPGKFRLSSNNVPLLVLAAKDPPEKGTAAMAWIHDRKNTTDALQMQRLLFSLNEGSVPADWVYRPAPLTGLTLTVLGLPDGTYTARWYASSAGEWLDEATFTVAGGEAVIAVPEFQGDVAVKIIK